MYTMHNYTRPIPPPRILLCGFYGCGNLGDDALLTALLASITENAPRAIVACLVGDDPALCARIGRDNVRFAPRMHPSVLSELLRSDTVILGGGSVLQNKTGNASLLYYLALLRLAQICGKRTALLAGGLGPIRGAIPRFLTASALNRLDHASFRDRDACRLARRLGVPSPRLSADPALLLRCDPTMRISLPDRFFLVSLKHGDADRDRTKQAADRLFLRAIRLSAVPILCDLFPREDAAWTRAVCARVALLAQRHAPHLMPRYLSLRSFRDPIRALLSVVSEAEAVVTGRYHLALFARAASVPCTAIGRDPKLMAIQRETRTVEELKREAKKDTARFFGMAHADGDVAQGSPMGEP